MNESKKLLIGFAIVGMLCCGVSVVTVLLFREVGNRAERMFNGDPTSVAEIRERIVDFDTPPGYETKAMSMFIYDMVILMPSGAGDESMIMLMQYNSIMSASPAQMEQQLRESAQQQGNQAGAPMHYVETIEREIRGETVEITLSEGSGMRQWLAVFEGKKGMTLLMVQGPVESWDDELLDDFIASIE